MSNYSRHFDDAGGGGGGGDRPSRGRGGAGMRTGRGGRYQSAIFAETGQKKATVARKCIDFNADLLLNEQDKRAFARDYRDRPMLEPTANSTRLLPALVDDVNHNPSMGICTKWISLAVNKTRTPITAMAWAPDGRRLITGSHTGEFTQWNGLQFNFEGIVADAHQDPVRVMTWSHNDLLMLTADEGGIIKYWQSTMNNIKAFRAHKEPVRDISFAPNDIHFVSCSDDQTASIWDLETSHEVVCLKGHGWDVKAARWHPTKGIILTGSKDQLIKVWDPRAGTGGMNHGRNPHCLADVHAHKNTVNRLAWSPINPNWFISGSRDNSCKVFDIRTMKDFQTNRNHKKEITSLTWHPTIERLFASGSMDGTINQWFVGETDTQAEIPGAHDSAVWGLQWHPLGHLLASSSNDQTTRFWARNRPGDDMGDRYNAGSLPAAQKIAAVSLLVEAAQKNPSKYSRLPSQLAEFVTQSQQEQADATAKSAYQSSAAAAAAASAQDFTSGGGDFIPGMGQVPGMGIKREEPQAAKPTGAAAFFNAPPPNMHQQPPSQSTHAHHQQQAQIQQYSDQKPIYSQSALPPPRPPASAAVYTPSGGNAQYTQQPQQQLGQKRGREGEQYPPANSQVRPPQPNGAGAPPPQQQQRFAPPPPPPQQQQGAGYNAFFPSGGLPPPPQRPPQQLPMPPQAGFPPPPGPYGAPYQQQQGLPPPPFGAAAMTQQQQQGAYYPNQSLPPPPMPQPGAQNRFFPNQPPPQQQQQQQYQR